jgi:hypothetical protein
MARHRAAALRAAPLAALAALLLLSAPFPASAAAKPTTADASVEVDAAALSRQAQAGVAKAARAAALDAAQGGHPGRTAGEAIAAAAGREAMAIKLARGPLAPGGTRTALESLSRSDNAAEAALACAAEWAQCGTPAERGELLTVSCELGDEDAFCFEGYLSDALVVPTEAEQAGGEKKTGDHHEADVAVFRCRRDQTLAEATSACAAPSASWTRASTGGAGPGGGHRAAAFSTSSTSSGDPTAALAAYQRIAAQAAEMRAGLLGVARLGGLAQPAGGFGGQFEALMAEDPLGPMGGMTFGMA